MSKDWMLFYHEATGHIFCFNGKWPILITPGGDPFGRPFAEEGQSATEVTENFIDELNSVLSSSKRVFTIKGQKYKIMDRGEFLKL